MSTRRASERRTRDAGAALILAIGFVVMIGAISAGLAGLVTSSLNNRGSLELVRDRQYAADGATEEAISQVRYAVGSPVVACGLPGGSIVDTLNGVTIRVDWHNACEVVAVADGTVVAQRDVVFAACVDTGAACANVDVIVRAQVNFAQASSGPATRTNVQSWSVNR